jgi:hypothetical protein
MRLKSSNESESLDELQVETPEFEVLEAVGFVVRADRGHLPGLDTS